jgi:hypothetical protein
VGGLTQHSHCVGLATALALGCVPAAAKRSPAELPASTPREPLIGEPESDADVAPPPPMDPVRPTATYLQGDLYERFAWRARIRCADEPYWQLPAAPPTASAKPAECRRPSGQSVVVVENHEHFVRIGLQDASWAVFYVAKHELAPVVTRRTRVQTTLGQVPRGDTGFWLPSGYPIEGKPSAGFYEYKHDSPALRVDGWVPGAAVGLLYRQPPGSDPEESYVNAHLLPSAGFAHIPGGRRFATVARSEAIYARVLTTQGERVKVSAPVGSGIQVIGWVAEGSVRRIPKRYPGWARWVAPSPQFDDEAAILYPGDELHAAPDGEVVARIRHPRTRLVFADGGPPGWRMVRLELGPWPSQLVWVSNATLRRAQQREEQRAKRLRFSNVSLIPSVHPEEAVYFLVHQSDEVNACYDDALAENPDLGPTVKAELAADPQRGKSAVRLTWTEPAAATDPVTSFRACVQSRMADWDIHPFTHLEFTLRFSPTP